MLIVYFLILFTPPVCSPTPRSLIPNSGCVFLRFTLSLYVCGSLQCYKGVQYPLLSSSPFVSENKLFLAVDKTSHLTGVYTFSINCLQSFSLRCLILWHSQLIIGPKTVVTNVFRYIPAFKYKEITSDPPKNFLQKWVPISNLGYIGKLKPLTPDLVARIWKFNPRDSNRVSTGNNSRFWVLITIFTKNIVQGSNEEGSNFR